MSAVLAADADSRKPHTGATKPKYVPAEGRIAGRGRGLDHVGIASFYKGCELPPIKVVNFPALTSSGETGLRTLSGWHPTQLLNPAGTCVELVLRSGSWLPKERLGS